MRQKLSVWTRFSFLACLAVGVSSSVAAADGLLQYRITSIDPNSWEVTAQQLGTGESIRFVMKANTFKGKTFNADLSGVNAGDSFSVRGPRNERVQASALRRAPAANQNARNTTAGPKGANGEWEIVSVNPSNWIVTARKKGAGAVRFSVSPQSFVGFEFQASVQDVAAGRGFTVVTPNNSAMANCCRMLD